jgi:hypothetical protein
MKGSGLKQLASDQPAMLLLLWVKLAATQFSGGNLLFGSGSEKGW